MSPASQSAAKQPIAVIESSEGKELYNMPALTPDPTKSTLPNSNAGAPIVNNNFWNSATGHAVLAALVTFLGSLATALVSSPAASTLLHGGLALTVLKYIVDLIRPGIENV